jgi:HD-like signal output (HDOD) protein
VNTASITPSETAAEQRGFVAEVLAGRVAMPMMPRVVMRAIQQLRKHDASVASVAAEFEQDAMLNSRVLRLANSSYFAGRRSVSSVHDAVALIGFKPLETLVIACGAQAVFADVPTVNLRQFWQSSVVTAAAARALAQPLRLDRDAAYTAGLLLGVGHLILCTFQPKQALAEFASIRHSWGLALAEREMRAFGATHGHISSLWVDQLGLPVAVAEAQLEAMQSEPPTPLAGVLQLATAAASAVAAGQSAQQARETLAGPLADRLGLAVHLAEGGFDEHYTGLKALGGLF